MLTKILNILKKFCASMRKRLSPSSTWSSPATARPTVCLPVLYPD